MDGFWNDVSTDTGTPAVLPQKTLNERGFKGRIYQTHGIASWDFLRIGGKDVEGTFLPAGPVLVVDQLPADHPAKKSAKAYVTTYEGAYGKGSVSTFGGHAWDAGLLLAAAIPEAVKKAQPGTPPGVKVAFAPDRSPPRISTSQIVAVDNRGGAVSMTTTIESYFGSHIMVRGFMLNNQLTDFSFTPTENGKPVANRVQAGKRPRSSMAPTLVFDEIDTGVGGAVADAIGKRLKMLANRVQVLAVTHAPQVAARAEVELTLVQRGQLLGSFVATAETTPVELSTAWRPNWLP